MARPLQALISRRLLPISDGKHTAALVVLARRGLDDGGGYAYNSNSELKMKMKKKKKRRINSNNGAVERDPEFEIDPDKAREALRKLDQQLQSMSRTQISPPRIRASDLNSSRDTDAEDIPDFWGSFLAYSASALLVFTIFYNVLFITVIKPSIDGPEAPEPALRTVEASEPARQMQFPLAPEVSVQP